MTGRPVLDPRAGWPGRGARDDDNHAHGHAADTCWEHERDRLLIRAVDALHDEADVPDTLWHRLSLEFSEPPLLDLLMLCGWYHAISFAANGARVPLENGAPRFKDVT